MVRSAPENHEAHQKQDSTDQQSRDERVERIQGNGKTQPMECNHVSDGDLANITIGVLTGHLQVCVLRCWTADEEDKYQYGEQHPHNTANDQTDRTEALCGEEMPGALVALVHLLFLLHGPFLLSLPSCKSCV